MRKLIHIIGVAFFILFAGLNLGLGQTCFRIVGGVPCLPALDPSVITNPAEGMLIFNTTNSKPMICTGTTWEDWCTCNISITTTDDYFIIKENIPYLPAKTTPGDNPPSGTMFYSTTDHAVMIFDGTRWTKLSDMANSTFSANSGFAALGGTLKTCKIPVLDSDPAPAGLTAGAFYINTSTKSIRYYNGAVWQNIGCTASITTLPATSITDNSAVSGGNITSNNGSAVIFRGICWSTSPNPDISLSTKTTNVATGDGIGTFNDEMKGLKSNTLYHVRAYAVNNAGIVYGDDKTFTTQIAMPTIITYDASNIQHTTAVTGGDITSDGGSAITARGVYWSTKGDPLTDPGTWVTHDGSGVGPFPTTLTSLLELTTYYIRAYAVNARGTSYGNLVQFTTPPAVVPVIGPVTISNVTPSSATGNINILNNGGNLVTERGVRWSTDRVNFQSAASTTTSDSDVGKFTAELTGLEAGTTYYVQAYAVNGAGTGYSVETSFTTASWVKLTTTPVSVVDGFTATGGGDITDYGLSQVTACGVCWSTKANPDITLTTKTSQTPSGDGLGPFASALTNLLPDTVYYVRAYAINGKGVSYGDELTFRTPKLAAITTSTVTNVTGFAAVCGGTISSDGGQPVTARGVCWSTSKNPTYVYNDDLLTRTYTSNGTGIGTFTSNITGLSPGTTYYVRAYAITSTGIAYGNEVSFTGATYAVLTTNPTTSISNISAVSGGNITDKGNSVISSLGVCWSTSPNPTIASNKTTETVNGDGSGSFLSTLTNLFGNTTYYARAYAINGRGVAYGDQVTFVTEPPVLPTITTLQVTDIANVSATSGGSIVSNGGAPISDSGICWSIIDPKEDMNAKYLSSKATEGTFTSKLIGLLGGTTYNIRAYVINSQGKAYGDLIQIKTLPATAPVFNPVDLEITNIDNTTASTKMTIVNDGGNSITSSGIEWGTNQTDVQKLFASTLGVGTFPFDFTGLLIRTTYYVRAFATNDVGTTYTNWTHFTTTAHATVTTAPVTSITGSSTITGGEVTVNPEETLINRGVCWSTTENPTIDYSMKTVQPATGSGEGTFISNIEGLSPNTKYYVRAYATNSTGTGYGQQLSFTTASVPSITTTAASNITGSKFDIGGSGLNDGGQDIIEKGVCWYWYNPEWTYTDLPTVDNSHINCGTGTDSFTTTLTNLLGDGRTYYVRAYATNSVGTTYGNLVIVKTAPVSTAMLKTTQPTEITSTSVSSGGRILDSGGDPSGTRGICWSIMNNPTITDNYSNASTLTNPYVCSATNLMGSTKYYVRAYMMNSAGIAYGDELSFTTAPPVLATVMTLDPTNVAGTTATDGGNVVSNGGADVVLRGICWSANENPTFMDDHADAHAAGNGSYSCDITGLAPLTKYYVRAYAVNSEGVAYGDQVSFTTFTTPTVITSLPSSITNISAVSGGTITSDGGVLVTSSGICWNTTGSATTADTHTTGGVGIGNFIDQLTNLLGNTIYYIRAYATNVAGTAYGDELTFTTNPAVLATLKTNPATGGSNGTSINGGGTLVNNGGALITNTGLCCGTITGFDPATQSVSKTTQTDTGNFTGILTGLTPGTTYYVRAYATNSVGTAYGDEVICKTPNLPQLTTTDATSITRNSSTAGGNISSDGGTTVTTSGVCWNTKGDPTIADDHTSSGTGIGSFTQNVTGLLGSTTYHLKAYATNGVGTAYGNEEVFTTLPPVLATVKTDTPTPTSGTTAKCGGTITDNGGAMVTTRGVVWSTNPDFNYVTESINRTAQTGYYTGSFTDEVKDLSPGTVYYLRAYVVNGVGISYGDMVSFQLPSLPTISTNAATSVKCNTAITGGNITSNGGVDLTGRGVIWSTIKDFVPDIQLATNKSNDYVSHSVYDRYGYYSYSYNDYPIGNYSSTITGLQGNTTYYVRSYATNLVGTSYGNQISFTTANPVLPTISTKAITNLLGNGVTGHGSIDNDGGATVTTRGFMWSEFSNFNPDTVTVNKVSQTGYTNGAFTLDVTKLKPGTTYYLRAFGVNSVGLAYGDPVSFTTLNVPTVTTTAPVAGSTGYTAVSGGNITNDGGAAVTNRGVCWSTSTKPTIGLISKTTGDSGNPFTSKMNNLTPATTYYVRAYATNSQGTAYGNELSFKTMPALPTLTTKVITGTSSSTADCGGDISNDGGAPITARGVRWCTTPNFNPDTIKVNQTKDGIGTGSFSSTLTGLSVSTSYYVRAYATNSAGTAYGNQVTVSLFPTSSVLDPTRAANITGTTADITGKIISNGGSTITTRGICWDINTNPTTKLTTKTAEAVPEDSLSICTFMHKMTGLAPNTKYYVRAYAINNIGTAYGLEINFLTGNTPTLTATTPVTNITATTATSGGQITDDGRMPILARGVCWSKYSNPTIDNSSKTVDTSSKVVGSFTAQITGLIPATAYYVRAYATNSVGTVYGSQVTFTTLDVSPPIVITDPVTSIISKSATGGGEILDDGGTPILTSGIYWGTSNPPTSGTTDGIKSIGTFTSSLTNLTPATKYYVQAYATNGKGTGKGDVVSFTTSAVLPQVTGVTVSNVTMSGASGTATITYDGGGTIVDQGFRWNISGAVPTADDKIFSPGTGSTSISGPLTGLTPGTKYYVWAYATNSIGTGYSASPTIFTTPNFPTVSTTAASSISYTTATTGGTVGSDGGSSVTARGVCWSTMNPPTISDSHIANGSGTGIFSCSLTGLLPGTTYYVRAYATNTLGTSYGDPITFTTIASATVATTAVSNVTSSSASCGGNVTADGGKSIVAWGICWSSSVTQPTITTPATAGVSKATTTVLGNGLGTYSISMPGLTSATTYYVRAFVCNVVDSKMQYYYGSVQTFNTASVTPTPTAVTISNIGATTADASASLISDGGSAVFGRGLRWNTTGLSPNSSDNTLVNDPLGTTIGGTLTGLLPSTKYYVWAYAENENGTGYSATPAIFTTTPLPVAATITTNIPSSITGNSATCGGNISSDGGASVTRRGVCWSILDSPTISDTYLDNGTGIGNFVCSITGLAAGTKYYVRAYAINTQGTVYGDQQIFTTLTMPTISTDAISSITSTTAVGGGNVVTDGGAPVTKRGICWNTTGNPTTSDKMIIDSGTGTGTYKIDLTGLLPTTTYYVRAYATNTQGTVYGNQISFATLPTPPTVSNVTIPADKMTNTTVLGNASVTDIGGASVDVRGLCWNTTGNPTVADNTVPDAGTGLGVFSGTLTGLTEGPTYYVRAYASNAGGMSYSPQSTSFKICKSVTVTHSILAGAPVNKSLTYNSVNTNISGASKCWITKNLGADLQAASAGENIDDSAGWYWQFNNPQGYLYSASTRTPVIWNNSVNENSDWVSANDPCMLQLGAGWRLPTLTEWTAADAAPQNWASAANAYSSVLKLHEAGYLTTSGVLSGRGTTGYYWSSTQSNTTVGNYLSMNSSSCGMSTISKTSALSVRCLRDDTSSPSVPILNQVEVLDATKTSSTIDGKAYIMFDGGATISKRGLCWNTAGNPTISDSKVEDASVGTGLYTNTMSGLVGNTTYYVRAFATNSAGTGYGVQTIYRLCTDMVVIHSAGINGAPVDKTVTYKVINTAISGAPHCWIAQNLGADQQATGVTDATEASSGWYWQFNRSLGYKHDGTTLTPTKTWIPWTTYIYESNDWAAANDPCSLLLGSGWRIPTITEWTNIDGSPRNWATASDAYNSELKLHEAGYLNYSNGTLASRGSIGNYWSSTTYNGSTYNPYYGWGYLSGQNFTIASNNSAVAYMDRACALPVRCLLDDALTMLQKASISDVSIPSTAITSTTATGTATVSLDGGSTVTERGLCWNTTGTTPTTSDNVIKASAGGTGTFTGTLNDLTEGPTYYVRAYAINDRGTSYSSNVTSFKVCQPLNISHKAGLNGAPVDKTVTYNTISTTLSGKAACWITQNLGSDQQATAVSDATEASSGWYWQFNRSQGYKHDGTALTPAILAWSSWVGGISENSDWVAANDPCTLELGTSWRIPTNSEWNAADNPPQNWLTATDAFNSVIKLHQAGYLDYSNGALTSRGTTGNYWSSSQCNTTSGYLMSIANGSSTPTNANKAYAYPIRCLRDQVVVVLPGVSDVSVPTATMTNTTAVGTATVTPDGGAAVTARGLCWNTTGNPTVDDNNVPDTDTGTGTFSGTLNGLTEGSTYYVRAYATNSAGTAYSNNVTSFRICPTFTVNHTIASGAPVDKTITYGSVSTTITGTAKCWITKNLGANLQAASAGENTDDSAGWYWQFNNPQGYQYSASTRIPIIWNTSVNENINWTAANDPCTLQLGAGWRLPTLAEWNAADAAPQYWQTAADAFASVLKLHEAGYLTTGGVLSSRGTAGYYWSSTQSNSTTGNYLSLTSGTSAMSTVSKTAALPVRCLRDETATASVPILNQVEVLDATKTSSTIDGKAFIMFDGGSAITKRGLCWNKTGNPTISDNKIEDGATSTGNYTNTISGLVQNTTYYVRAFATNSAGTGYGVQTAFRLCPDFTVIHSEGINGAPVSKTVTYKQVSTSISGTPRCWIAQNLGADQQATDVTDATETSAGWYWQFNRIQGYKHDGTNITPYKTWVPWVTYIYESNDWAATNDPCGLLLGSGWRMPTITEWTNVDGSPRNWATASDAYNSELKLHEAGYLNYSNGTLASRGSIGNYWSSSTYNGSTYNPYYGWGYLSGQNFTIASNNSVVTYMDRACALPIRCLKDESLMLLQKASISDVSIPSTAITSTTATGTATVSLDGGATVTERGICWNTTGTAPTTSDNVIKATTGGTGTFTGTLNGLTEGPTYYVRAYAINDRGISYSTNVTSFKVCQPLTISHKAGLNGAPVDKTVIYNTISTTLSGKAACWITQNLGSDQQATAVSDATEASSGWYWQFNRSQGYKHDGTALTPAIPTWSSWASSINENSDWIAANDPCNLELGTSWRIPTNTEWTAADAPTQNWLTATDAFNSVIKLHQAGYLDYSNGALTSRGTTGNYWSSSQLNSTSGNLISIASGNSSTTNANKSYAYPLRCLRDQLVIALPGVSDVSVPTATITNTTAVGTATVTPDGGSTVTARGLCWNTTGNPTTSDHLIPDASGGLGTFSGTLNGLTEGPTYYVRAYATNSTGTAYSKNVASFRICPTFTINHKVESGAPVDKTVTYGSISTTITGTAKCWITKNLGADLQAASVGENSDETSGWFWQFNNPQGYQYSESVRTPVLWNTSVNDNSNWAAANDPCILQLGAGWRLPTLAEWNAADAAPQYWQTAADAFASVLKLHEAGYLTTTAALSSRGTAGYYWSSTQSNSTTGNYLSLNSGTSVMSTISKTAALPVRCLRDETANPSVPILNQAVVLDATKTSTTIDAKAFIMFDGGASISKRGLCWNTTGNPTISDNKIEDGATSTGSYTNTIGGLAGNTTYYVRAFATNGAGTGYGVQTAFRLCPDFTVIHTEGVNGAPVSKTVTYKQVSTSISGTPRCWIAQNLGADQQATDVTDATEASAGWYWQFNRTQGYKHDGTILTPTKTYVPWTTYIYENNDWAATSDPCSLLLGAGWRMPTITEWTNVDGSPRNWATASDAYNSELKLHEAGYLNYSNGTLASRGSIGNYWSSTTYNGSTYNPNYGWGYLSGQNFAIASNNSAVTYMDRACALPVRCLKDESLIVLQKASITDASIPTAAITASSATATATVSLDGGATVTERGICWNTTGTPPTTSDNVIKATTGGTGTFTGTLNGLTEGPTYYVRSYAINDRGTSYSSIVTSFKICQPLTISHKAGLNGSPVDKTVTYNTISTTLSGKAACWITQNLGSDQQATAVNDATEASSGWYWQFNRSQGYKHDGTALTPAIPAWTSWTSSINENSDWVAANDPCTLELGTSWRIPTNTEWNAADNPPQNWLTSTDAFNSVIKLHQAGYLDYSNGALTSRGTTGNYWSSSQYNSTSGNLMSIASGSSNPTYANKSYAYPLRCLRDQLVIALPGVGDVSVPTATITNTTAVGTATVTPDGGAAVTARGLCWNNTGNPTISDHLIPDASGGIGTFSGTLNGLTEGPTYYVRAYATNSVGTAYSKNVASFKICPTFTVNHTIASGAPVDKAITYGSISTNITGSSKCWITKNLGADLQAASVGDNIDDSAGWYWQFDNAQGYQYSGTTRTPVLWNTNVNENNDWLLANDPCMLQLGAGWRLPTYTEWNAADAAPQFWQTANDAFASVLKLHEAGYLNTSGVLNSRGSAGYYWSSTQSNSTTGNYLSLTSGTSVMSTVSKTAALPVRCLRDNTATPSVPILNQAVVLDATKTSTTIDAKAFIMFDGGASISKRGLCWNTTGNPTISDGKIEDGATSTGNYTNTMSGLVSNTTYYVRAYATNGAGTGYGVQTAFRLCPDFTVIHSEGVNGAPVSKTVTYKQVSSLMSGTPRCWIAQNLGADQQATAVTDATEASAGWYWQFNRTQGYKHDGTILTPTKTWIPWTTYIYENNDWAAANDPCSLLLGSGWRMPTVTEWTNVDGSPRNWATASDAYNSELKLHEAGYLNYSNGTLYSRGSVGNYWSSTTYNGTTYNPNYGNGYLSSQNLSITSGSSSIINTDKACALPVRCLKDESLFILQKASISDASIPTAAITGSTATATATVSLDGGANVNERGICWNTTGIAPTTTDNVITSSSGTGTYTATMTGLTEGPTYYVRAYAINSRGITYSTNITSFKICSTLTVTHTAGVNGSPATKTVNYKTISATVSGKAVCWITQNLGSDQQATAVNDATEASAGWYWQFNHSQGYKHDGTVLTPSTGWIASISETTDWLISNDPCALQLGVGWRIPTNTEWTATDNPPQNWLTSADAFNSVLKIHQAGYLLNTNGALNSRGTIGNYWSSTQVNSTAAYNMNITGSASAPTNSNKSFGYSLRCIKD